ncbi:MAG: glycosyltransferase [Planctomycetaceae bacterium]
MSIWDICLTHDPVYGGIHRSVSNFAQALDAGILSFDDGAVDRAGLREERPVVRVACRPRAINRACHWVTPAMAAAAGRAVAGADLLVIHSLFRGHAPWAARWCHDHDRTYFSVLEGCLDPWGLANRALAKRLWLAARGRPFFANAAKVIAATSREAAKAEAWVPAGRLAVVHWPVAVPSAAGRDAARHAFRAAHGIPEQARVLLFVGRLHPMKRPAHMVEAFLRAGVPGCHLVVAGMEEGVSIASLEGLVPPEAAGRVHCIGPLAASDVVNACHAADGFISLSHRENFGYSLAEAITCGLPVIVTPGHDLAHDIAGAGLHGFPCGWLLPDDTAATAIAAIRDFAATPAARLEALGAAGRAWAADHLSFDRFRDALRGLAADAVAPSRGRR